MPSFSHELLVELFRNDGLLAVELLRRCAGITLAHARVAVGSIDLSQVAPTEYRADAVVVLLDHDDRPAAGVIVEVQRSIERDKALTWPAYVATLRAKLACAALLLVIAPDPAVASWARRPIDLGHPGFRLTPIVIGFEEVPWVRDRDAALRLPELAVLSVLAHPELEIAELAIAAIAKLPADQARLYLDVIMMALPAALRQILEARMQGYEYQSDFARKYYGQGREEGLRAAALALARTKLEPLSDDDLTAIEGLSDQAVLTVLITSLGQARNLSEARVALSRALASG